jgi:hypothetical protein
LDPFIDNPEVEHDRIIAEGLEQALVAGIQQQAAGGTIPPLVLAKVMRFVKDDKLELAEALQKVTDEALAEQQRQQEEEAAAAEQMTPDMAAAGATIQSMAGPQAMPTVGGPSASQENLLSLLSTLRRPGAAQGGV